MRSRFLGLLVGLVFTMVVQSSSATTVMVVGFVRAGLMDLHQAAGVIFGANIGTTITAQLIALQVSDAAPVLLLAGVLLHCFCRRRFLQDLGGVLAGFGMLFLGLTLMGATCRRRPIFWRSLRARRSWAFSPASP